MYFVPNQGNFPLYNIKKKTISKHPLADKDSTISAYKVIIDVHPNPVIAKCDAKQALLFNEINLLP